MSRPSIELVEADCLEWMSGRPERSVRCVVTSPPYNLSVRYATHRDDQPREQYLDWIGSVFVGLRRVLTDDGHLFVNLGYSNKDPFVAFEVAERARAQFQLQNMIHWIKSLHVAGKTHGHFKPVNSKRFSHLGHEFVFHFTKSGEVPVDRLAVGVPYEYESNIERFSKTKAEGQRLRCRGNTWFVPYDTIQDRSRERGAHPATFPVALPEMCLRFAGLGSPDAGRGLVYDPFVGTGTTLLACQRLGLEAVGTDIDGAYLEFARSRLGETVGGASVSDRRAEKDIERGAEG